MGPQANIDALVSSPVAPRNSVLPHSRFSLMSSAIKTPQTSSRLYPTIEEMHPSKVHQSTIKPSPSRQGLGSIASRMSASPSKSTIIAVTQQTPSKSRDSLPGHMTSPTFDFSFERPETDLSSETQKIMDSVREEAARIKAQMLEERSKQEHVDGEADQLYGFGGRKINKPKGKSGRYSDIHKQEFKRMESIASHASLWKNKLKTNTSSLKRSPSKAGLDQPEKPLGRTKSFRSIAGLDDSRERLENTAPGKRAKQRYGDDASATRPVSREANSDLDSTKTTPAKAQPHSGLPSAITTPTKASLARSASVKHMKTSMIPSLGRSASTKTLKSPAMPKTEGSNKYFSSLSRFGNMKSILHRSQPKLPINPTKITAETRLPLPQGKLELDEDLPSLPGTPSIGLQRSPTFKRVAFTPSMKSCGNLGLDSPSPSKIPTPYTQSQAEVSALSSVTKETISYPTLAESPNVIIRTKIPRASTPGDFTFRAEKTISFSPSKDTTVTSPGSTIRHVRPSGVPTKVPSFDTLAAIPHGLPNKKRSRPDSDTEAEDTENKDPMDTTEDFDDNSQGRAKRQRMSISPEKAQTAESPLKRRIDGSSKTPKSAGKGRKGLSLARLNMLARPKERH